jgi:hypothetical protein
MTGDDYLYHVTLASNLMSIQEDDLVPGAGQSFGGGYEGHARGRLFMCEHGAVFCWWNKIEDLVHHNFEGEQIVEGQHIPVVLRFPRSLVEDDLQHDELGSRDCIGGESYFITGEPVPTMDIDIWDGKSWVSIVDLDAPEEVTAAYIESATEEMDEYDGEETSYWDVQLQLPGRAEWLGEIE